MAEEQHGYHLYLVSDATGETLNIFARACLVQFENIEPHIHHWNLIQHKDDLDDLIPVLKKQPGLVLYSFVDEQMGRRMREICHEVGSLAHGILDQAMNVMASYFDARARAKPGLQHLLDADYFARIEAMEFALNHDDGQQIDTLHQADVILTGVSRTSKTPTCLYLANRGIKAANVPFVPGTPLPTQLGLLKRPLIIGLTNDPERLITIRRNRLRHLGGSDETAYVNNDDVREEILAARRFFTKQNWPIIDTTKRSIEETAAEILAMLERRAETRKTEDNEE